MFTCDQAPGSIDPSSVLSWTAEQLRRVEDALKSLGKRQAYPVAWTAIGTPAIGNGTLRGEYVELGAFLVVNIHLIAGSTTTFGTPGNAWNFSLPRAPLNTGMRWAGGGVAFDSSTSNAFVLAPKTTPGTANLLISMDNVIGDVSAGLPFAWATGDYMVATIGYPLA